MQNDESPKSAMSLKIKEEENIFLGIIAMEKKSNCKPMRNIVKHLQFLKTIKIKIWNEKEIFEDRIEDWPRVECLITFYSKNFPLQKVIDYVDLVKPPLVINDPKK